MTMYGDYTPSPERRRLDLRRYPSVASNPERRRYYTDRRYPSSVQRPITNGYDDVRRYPNEYPSQGRSRYDDARSVAYSPNPDGQRNDINQRYPNGDYRVRNLRSPPHMIRHDQPPSYHVQRSRYHGFPSHVFTGQRSNGDNKYYFTQNDTVDRNIRQHRLPLSDYGRHGDDMYFGGSDYDDEDEFYVRPRRKPVRRRRVHVKIEHWKGVIGQSAYNDIKDAIYDIYDENEVTIEEEKGRLDTFEVYVNDQLMFSRSRSGGYPKTADVLQEVRNARHGRPVRRVRNSESRTCTIL